MLKQLTDRIEANRAEMISSLSKLISIPSVAVETKGLRPFGDKVHEAYEMMLDMAESDGFGTFDADGLGGHIDFFGQSGIMGMVGHLDVVPEGDGWDFDPYSGEVVDGYVCGRGTMDDKGPVIAAYYAMKSLKEAGFRPDKTVRLILGLDEETNWKGMEGYLASVGDTPDVGFTPDGDFPVIHGEMGILVFEIARKFAANQNKGLELTSIVGGTVANAVPDQARAVMHDTAGGNYDLIKEQVAGFREEHGVKINCKGIGKSFEVTVQGVSAHGAKPEQGKNAISILMDFLSGVNFVNDDVADFVEFYKQHIGYDLHGERMGCELCDEPSGKLIWNVGMIELDKKAAKLTVNVRYPVTAEADQVYDGMKPVLDRFNLGVVKGKHQYPIYKEAEGPLVSTLMDVYREHTGDTESKPLVIGGGTYARAFDNILAFGARFPGEPELGHQKNEKISVDNLMKLTGIYADAIIRLAGGTFDGQEAD